MGINDDLILLVCPFPFIDVGIKMVVPSLSTLLSESSLQLSSNERPFLVPVNLDKPNDSRVFLGCPRSLNQTRFENLLPTM